MTGRVHTVINLQGKQASWRVHVKLSRRMPAKRGRAEGKGDKSPRDGGGGGSERGVKQKLEHDQGPKRHHAGAVEAGGGGREQAAEERRKVKVHLARFVEYQPHIVTAMAYEPESEMLAVARGNGDIQLWRTAAPRWHAVGSMTGSSSSQIRSVCWVRRDDDAPRLFSGALDGAITEWSLQTLRPCNVTDSQGGSVWCMAISHSGERLAAACHDGAVRIFHVSERLPGQAAGDELVFERLLPRNPGEVLSVAWGPLDRVLVSATCVAAGTLGVLFCCSSATATACMPGVRTTGCWSAATATACMHACMCACGHACTCMHARIYDASTHACR